MKQLPLISSFLVILLYIPLLAMEVEGKKEEGASPSTAPASEQLPKKKANKRQMNIVKMWSKSQGSSTDWLQKVYERNKETIQSLRQRFNKLKNASSYNYSPLELLKNINEIYLDKVSEDTLKTMSYEDKIKLLSNDEKCLYDAQLRFGKKARGTVSAQELLQEIDEFALNRKKLYQSYQWVASTRQEKVSKPSEAFFQMWEPLLDEKGEELSEEQKEERKNADKRIFVQKKLFSPDTAIHVFPDIQGDIKSLMKVLEAYVKDGILTEDLHIKDKHAIICLGDYSDEGLYSTEVLYTLLYIANANPDKMLLGRGHHEHLKENFICFLEELEKKFDGNEDKKKSKGNSSDKRPLSWQIMEKIHFFYRLLPAAFFIGKKDNYDKNYIDFICASHAGLEIGYQGYDQLLAHDSENACQWLTINRSAQVEKLPIPIKNEIRLLADDKYYSNLAAELTNKENVVVTDIRSVKAGNATYNLGFCHDNYQLEATKGISYSQLFKTWWWSKSLTESVLKLWSNKSWYRTTLMWLNWPLRKLFGWGFNNPTYSVVANIRGHQHSYDYNNKSESLFMKKLITHKGCMKMWEADDKQAIEPLAMKPGTVASLLCLGADNQYTFPFQIKRKKKPEKNNKGGDKYFVPFTFATVATLTFNSALSAWCLKRNNIQVFNRFDHNAFGIDTRDSIVGIEELN